MNAAPAQINPKYQQIINSLSPKARQKFMAEVSKKAIQEKKAERFKSYQFDFTGYSEKFLGWNPWGKQQEIIDSYTLALRQQHERRDYEAGTLSPADMLYWQPGQVIQNWILIDAGHSVGKTKVLAGLGSHFFDCFPPSIIYAFAPAFDQINDLLFKEIRTDREGKDLPGKVLKDPEVTYKGNHFIKGRATNDAHGQGRERIHGQHNEYLMFIVDEAEGIPKYVWDSIESMASGGISIIISARNPRTTTCQAHRLRRRTTSATFRISCLDHPNVIEDREIIPASVRRQYVIDRLEGCDIVSAHNPDHYTFELPWQPGTIYKPDLEFMWRVLGVASATTTDNTFCPPGRYEAAKSRVQEIDFTQALVWIDAGSYQNEVAIYYKHGSIFNYSKAKPGDVLPKLLELGNQLKEDGVTSLSLGCYLGRGRIGYTLLVTLETLSDPALVALYGDPAISEDDSMPWSIDDPTKARIGVDCARYGNDTGTVYCRHDGAVWREIEIVQQDGYEYYLAIKLLCQRLAEQGVKDIQIRVDGGGGYGSTAIDNLNRDEDLQKLFESFRVIEFHNNGLASDPLLFADLITEMYYHAGQALKSLKLINPPTDLETDLCDRPYGYIKKAGVDVKKLQEKEKFKSKHHRSPDNGDGLSAAAAPDYIFTDRILIGGV